MSINLGLLFLRVTFSLLLIILHGIPKLQLMFSKNIFTEDIQFVNIMGMGDKISLVLAVITEVVLPLFIILGFKTRLASIPVAITMLAAIFIYHANDPIAGKELAIVYLFGFITLALTGAGKYSIDKK